MFDAKNEKVRSAMSLAFDEISNNVILNVNKQHVHNILYENTYGRINIFNIVVKPNDNVSNVFDYNIYMIETEFIPASPYVIITKMDSDIFSSSTTQEIKYLDANVNDEHFDSLININMGLIENYGESKK